MNGTRHRRSRSQDQQRGGNAPLLQEEVVKAWIDGELTLENVEALQKSVHQRLGKISRTRLRKFYNLIVSFRNAIAKQGRDIAPSEMLREIYRLQIILAYEKGRESKDEKRNALESFAKMNRYAITALERKKDKREQFKLALRRFLEMMEAIVAFHSEKAEKQ